MNQRLFVSFAAFASLWMWKQFLSSTFIDVQAIKRVKPSYADLAANSDRIIVALRSTNSLLMLDFELIQFEVSCVWQFALLFISLLNSSTCSVREWRRNCVESHAQIYLFLCFPFAHLGSIVLLILSHFILLHLSRLSSNILLWWSYFARSVCVCSVSD